MTRHQAFTKAHTLWGTRGIEPGDRVGFVVVRRKSVDDRFEVGYYTRGDRAPSGMVLSHDYKVMGKGSSWEEAFARASDRCVHCGLTRNEGAAVPEVLCIDRGTHDFGAAEDGLRR